jgi:hypothetical protein
MSHLVVLPDPANDVFSDLGVAVFLTLAGDKPSLVTAILVVVGIGAKKQMLWVHTRPVVTFMQNVLANWDRASVYLPCQPVGIIGLTICVYKPVTVPLNIASPGPTLPISGVGRSILAYLYEKLGVKLWKIPCSQGHNYLRSPPNERLWANCPLYLRN